MNNKYKQYSVYRKLSTQLSTQLSTFQLLIGLFFKHAEAELKNADAYKKKCMFGC